MNTKTPTPPSPKLGAKLSSGINVDFQSAKADELRKFSGIGNSGRPFNYFGNAVVIDFDNITFKFTTAILHEHVHPAGAAQITIDEQGLRVSGHLLSNEHGSAIAKDSDEGFPWEMSVYVIAGRMEQVKAGSKLAVNGHQVVGPVEVWRDCVVREVSFTAVGVDANTSAKALSDLNQPKKDEAMTQEEQEAFNQLKADVEALKKANTDAEAKVKTLEAEKAEAEKAAQEASVDVQLSAAGFKRTEDGKGFAGVSQATYGALLSAKADDAKAMIADLKPSEAKPNIPHALLHDLHQPPQPTPQDGKLSGLAADAAARHNKGANYV